MIGKSHRFGALARLRHMFGQCRHDWSITGVNGFGVIAEEQCLKCRAYHHRILRSEDLGKTELVEWQDGRHPGVEDSNH